MGSADLHGIDTLVLKTYIYVHTYTHSIILSGQAMHSTTTEGVNVGSMSWDESLYLLISSVTHYYIDDTIICS